MFQGKDGGYEKNIQLDSISCVREFYLIIVQQFEQFSAFNSIRDLGIGKW